MRKLVIFPAALACGLCLFAAATAKAGDTAIVYVAHGINGQDLGLDPSLPVDVNVAGLCVPALNSLSYGEIRGPFVVPTGTLTIQIGLANTVSPCSSTPVISANVPFSAGENASVVAYLNAAGSPTASKFDNDLSPAMPNTGRIIAFHTAAAPAVDATLWRYQLYAPLGGGLLEQATIAGGSYKLTLSNGQQGEADIPLGTYQASIAPTGTQNVVLGPASIATQPNTATLVFVFGSASKGTLKLVTKELDLKVGSLGM